MQMHGVFESEISFKKIIFPESRCEYIGRKDKRDGKRSRGLKQGGCAWVGSCLPPPLTLVGTPGKMKDPTTYVLAFSTIPGRFESSCSVYTSMILRHACTI